MKNIILLSVASLLLLCCNNNPAGKTRADNYIVLRTDTLNVVKLTDTLIIPESTCRGCEYEKSTHFETDDSTGTIRLKEVITEDNNPADMDGGSISKTIVLFSTKTGKQSFKLYKFWDNKPTAKDSALFKRYHVEVIN